MSNTGFLSFAKNCALNAGEIIREGFHQAKKIDFKGIGDPVTEFDRRSEELIVGAIRKEYPGHGVLGEEATDIKTGSGIRWIIDPLDGTVNFTHSIPLIAISIAVEVEGKIKAGVIYNPILNDMYEASEGNGAFHNGQPVRVSEISDPEKALVITGFPYKRDRVDEIMKPMRTFVEKYEAFRRLGSAAIDMAYIACGMGEVFYEEELKPWDTAAGSLIVTESGGIVSDYYGGGYSPENSTILAANPSIYYKALEIMKKVAKP